MLAPCLAIKVASSARPPGLSETINENRINRLSKARPRSILRPSTVVSIFPPVKSTTTLEINKCSNKVSILVKYIDYFFPPSSGKSPCNSAAKPTAPAPSTTAFSTSISRRIASVKYSSLECL